MKLLFKNLIITLFLCVTTHILCMDSPHNAFLYFKQCRHIDKKNEKKIIALCNTNPIKALDNIAFQLKKIQQNLDNRRQNGFIAIKQNYAISDDIWKGIMEIQQTLCEFEEANKNNGLPNVTHDKDLPTDIVVMLKTNLISNGINPERIDLKFSTGNCSPRMAWPVIGWSLKNHLLSMETTRPGLIEIHETFINNSSHIKRESWCLFLVANMKELTAYSHIFKIIQEVTEINIDKVDMSLLKHLMPLSILTLAFKKKYYAQLLRTNCSTEYNPNFSIKDYKLLSKIDRLHRALAWLKKYTN
jgi:hypothetical protein